MSCKYGVFVRCPTCWGSNPWTSASGICGPTIITGYCSRHGGSSSDEQFFWPLLLVGLVLVTYLVVFG